MNRHLDHLDAKRSATGPRTLPGVANDVGEPPTGRDIRRRLGLWLIAAILVIAVVMVYLALAPRPGVPELTPGQKAAPARLLGLKL
jgi:hypothetical protein